MNGSRRILRRFADDRNGAAVVEFALILPIMLLLYLGTMEASTLISVDRRVQTVSATVGDLVARSDETISASALRDYFRAAENIVAPYATTSLVQTVSMISIDEGETTIEWSRTYDGSNADENHEPGRTVGDSYPLPPEILDIAQGFVIVSETRYTYTPLLGLVFEPEFPLYKENFYLPRFGEEIEYQS